jgi:hypothetical protein
MSSAMVFPEPQYDILVACRDMSSSGAGTPGERSSVTWDTRDEYGQHVPNGVHFVRLLPAQDQAQAQAVSKVIVQR